MAGKRKAEGIALLSVYNDEDTDVDEDMEDLDVDDDPEEQYPSLLRASTPTALASPRFSAPETSSFSSIEDAPLQEPPDEVARGAHGIVDYAHDEAAVSPEAEEGEILSIGWAIYGQDLQTSNGNMPERAPPDKLQTLTPIKDSPIESEDLADQLKVKTENRSADCGTEVEVAASVDVEMSVVVADVVVSEDPLADFLPPLPPTKCPDELQNKFTKYLTLKNAGRSFNEELRKSKGYRNPDFLQRAVKYQEIDQIGSCFKKEVFDPHGYDASDFYDALALELRREMERKEQEKKRSQRVDFVHGGVQSVPSTVPPDNRSKPIIPILGGQKGVGAVNAQTLVGATATNTNTGIQTVTASSEASGKADGRSSKKSKWDKVDNDGRAAAVLPAGAKDAIAAASAQATLLSANAGAGYASFAHQKRKEAEERARSSEKSILKADKKADRS